MGGEEPSKSGKVERPAAAFRQQRVTDGVALGNADGDPIGRQAGLEHVVQLLRVDLPVRVIIVKAEDEPQLVLVLAENQRDHRFQEVGFGDTAVAVVIQDGEQTSRNVGVADAEKPPQLRRGHAPGLVAAAPAVTAVPKTTAHEIEKVLVDLGELFAGPSPFPGPARALRLSPISPFGGGLPLRSHNDC